MTRPFVIDLSWGALLDALGVRAADLLRTAGLPEDLFAQVRPTVSAEGFERLCNALYDAVGGEAPGLKLAQAISPEVFSPPLFAAYCSADLLTAAQRLSLYKPLIGPLRLTVEVAEGTVALSFAPEPGVHLADEYAAGEMVFLVSLARRATGAHVVPMSVEMIVPPAASEYATFFECPVVEADANRVVFSIEDATRPFRSANPALFNVFDPDLRARLDELAQGATVAERVRATLMEALPGGQPDVHTVAKRLGMSTRTLQRRLGAEGVAFQELLRALRERLARDYLSRTAHTSAEISFLLGYEDPNSFIRAFHGWTGTTPEAIRTSPG